MRDKANDPGHRYLIDILDHFILLDLFYSLNNLFCKYSFFFQIVNQAIKEPVVRQWGQCCGYEKVMMVECSKSNKTR